MTDYIKSIRKYIGHERLMIVGGSVIVHKNGKVLLQLRRDNGCWGYHGGCVELGETVEETAKRELFEETGLVANKLDNLPKNISPPVQKSLAWCIEILKNGKSYPKPLK
jgi:8-oxo-dGTP pyrophosphatase MutT (NUDIX family)